MLHLAIMHNYFDSVTVSHDALFHEDILESFVRSGIFFECLRGRNKAPFPMRFK